MKVETIKWISVKDSYPEDDTYVLVYGSKYPDMAIVYYDGCCYNLGNDEVVVDITHWMSLPEAPE